MADLLGGRRRGAAACVDHTRRGPDPNRDPTAGRRCPPPRAAPQLRRTRSGGTLARVSTDPKDRWLDLGSFIREQRGSARLSLRRLSELAGISNPYLSQIERGLRRPSAEILQQIAKALRISAETLYVQAGILEPPSGLARPDPGDHGRPVDQRGAEAGPRADLPLLPARARGRAGRAGPGRCRTPGHLRRDAGPGRAPGTPRPGRARLCLTSHDPGTLPRLAGAAFPAAGRL